MDIIIVAVIGFVIIIAGVVIAPTVKLAMDVAPYLYTNTRCSARAGRLLRRKEYETMLGSSSMREVFAFLEETSYRSLVEHSHSFAETSKLLEQDLRDTFVWLATVVPEQLQPVINAFLTRFEVAQLKEALNMLKRGERIGELPFIRDEQVRLKLSGVTDFASFCEALAGTPYEAVVGQGSLEKLAELTTALDRHALISVQRAIAACKDTKAAEAFSAYWKRVIDLANLRIALRTAGKSARYLEGGTIARATLEDVTEQNQLREVLEKSPYGTDNIELGVQRALKREAGIVNAKYPLKGGAVVRFIIDKELEVRNLNILLKLKSEGFSAEAVQQHLVI